MRWFMVGSRLCGARREFGRCFWFMVFTLDWLKERRKHSSPISCGLINAEQLTGYIISRSAARSWAQRRQGCCYCLCAHIRKGTRNETESFNCAPWFVHGYWLLPRRYGRSAQPDCRGGEKHSPRIHRQARISRRAFDPRSRVVTLRRPGGLGGAGRTAARGCGLWGGVVFARSRTRGKEKKRSVGGPPWRGEAQGQTKGHRTNGAP